MHPLIVAAAIQTAGNALQAGFSGGDRGGQNSVASYVQLALIGDLQKRALTGNLGDMGGGTAFRQGQANFGQQMADRGVDPRSGAYMAGMGNVAAQAQQMDTNALRQYILGLAGTPVQYVSGSGFAKNTSALPYSFSNPNQFGDPVGTEANQIGGGVSGGGLECYGGWSGEWGAAVDVPC
jgi:hypothetical protein